MTRMASWALTYVLFLMISGYSSISFPKNTENQCLASFNKHIINATTAWFDDCHLYDKDLPVIISYLNQHPDISQLHLLSNHIGDKGALQLSKLKNITVLELGKNRISRKGAILLLHSSIPMLDLQGNHVNAKNLSKLAQNKSDFSALASGDKTIILT